MSIRKAAVAGQFYEADTVLLRQQVTDLLSANALASSTAAKALIVPHAGYIYSGSTAASAYSCLQSRRNDIRRVVLFGPAHRVYLEGMAVPSVDLFATPLGDIPLDQDAIQQITDMPGVCVSDQAHEDEHSLEVQLPFLQMLLTQFSLVPVVVGKCEPATVAAVIDELWGGNDTLVVISTDLSHFLPYAQATQVDARTCSQILAKASTLSGEDACGAHAVNGLMCSEHVGALEVELLNVCNSGDSAGNKDRVVGYGAFLLH